MEWGINNSGVLRAYLPHCPNLQHISVHWDVGLDSATLDYICCAYGRKLKSLRLRQSVQWLEDDDPNIDSSVMALSKVCKGFSLLERLYLDIEPAVINRFEFSSAQLPSLRLLILELYSNPEEGSVSLFTEKLRALATLPSLRCLDLSSVRPTPALSFLEHFSRLEYLYVIISTTNIDSFLDAIPHLGLMKALTLSFDREIKQRSNSKNATLAERLLSAFFAHLHMLEHLDLRCPVLNERSTHLLSRMRQVRSLSYDINMPHDNDDDWNWLEQMTQLEYLAFWSTPNVEVLCNLIQNFKGLRYLKGPYMSEYTAKEWGTMVDRLIEAANPMNKCGDVRQSILSIGLVFATSADLNLMQIRANANTKGSTRVRFCGYKKSHIENLYKFGCEEERWDEVFW